MCCAFPSYKYPNNPEFKPGGKNPIKATWVFWATVFHCLFRLSVMLMYCGKTARWIKMPLDTAVGLSPGHIVLDGDPAPPKRGTAPQFSARVCCGQIAGWIKMPFGMEVGLSTGDIVLDGDPAPPKKGHSTAHFLARVFCGQMAGWIKMPLGMEVDLGPGHMGPSFPQKVAQQPRSFRPMSIVDKML